MLHLKLLYNKVSVVVRHLRQKLMMYCTVDAARSSIYFTDEHIQLHKFKYMKTD